MFCFNQKPTSSSRVIQLQEIDSNFNHQNNVDIDGKTFMVGKSFSCFPYQFAGVHFLGFYLFVAEAATHTIL